MTGLTAAQRQRIAAERQAQGLPPHVTDAAVLDRIVGMVLATQMTSGKQEAA
jgi:hypothetical protein